MNTNIIENRIDELYRFNVQYRAKWIADTYGENFDWESDAKLRNEVLTAYIAHCRNLVKKNLTN